MLVQKDFIFQDEPTTECESMYYTPPNSGCGVNKNASVQYDISVVLS